MRVDSAEPAAAALENQRILMQIAGKHDKSLKMDD